jgi:uncharacterized membrane protein
MPWMNQIAAWLASAIELVMMFVLTIGTIRALKTIAPYVLRRESLAGRMREVWLHYAGWIVLALEFALAADLIRTMVEPNWAEIGQLAAIGAIRTSLAWFHARDIAEYRVAPAPAGAEM